MSTVLSYEERQSRKEEAAIAELERNGVKVQRSKVRLKPVLGIARELGLDRAPDVYDAGPPLAPLPSKTREFRSRPDAQPMQRSDIANVQFLNVEAAREILDEVAKTAPHIAAEAVKHVYQNYRFLLTEGERFTLSAMAARKYMRELQTV